MVNQGWADKQAGGAGEGPGPLLPAPCMPRGPASGTGSCSARPRVVPVPEAPDTSRCRPLCPLLPVGLAGLEGWDVESKQDLTEHLLSPGLRLGAVRLVKPLDPTGR